MAPAPRAAQSGTASHRTTPRRQGWNHASSWHWPCDSPPMSTSGLLFAAAVGFAVVACTITSTSLPSSPATESDGSADVAAPDRFAADCGCGSSQLNHPDGLELQYSVGGEAFTPGSTCSPSTKSVTVSFVDRTLRITRCVVGDGGGADGGTATNQVTYDGPLESNAAAAAQAVLLAMREVPRPTTCIYDGPHYSLTTLVGTSARRYEFEDYNCQHRTDVTYATGDVRELLRVLETNAP